MCKLRNSIYVVLFMFLMQYSMAQVGINTATPDASSMLDVVSTTKGMLAPRMTTLQKNAITTPANGLLVFDTDFKEFSYYDSVAGWINIKQGRTNFKRIKSTDVLANVLAAELAAGGGTKYEMLSNTLYEINGTVSFNLPIEMNNSYISGLDSGDDKIVRASGNLFEGSKGGTVKGLTLVASTGKIFNVSGANTENIIFRDCIVANSASVGSINGLGLVFFSVVQFSGNTTGIEYSNISQLLLSNMGWFGNNSGTFEKLTGTFGLVQKQGGFTQVDGAKIGFDVSENPVISGDAVMESVVFTGVPTGAGAYVKPYTVGTYTGFNFNNKWTVRCAGIPNETDAVAVGDINFDLGIGYGYSTTLVTGADVKISGVTTSNNFFRMSSTTDNRITYLGNKKRFFTVNAALSFVGTNTTDTKYIFFIKKNGTISIGPSKTYAFTTNVNDIRSSPIQCVIEMNPGDYIEVFANRFSGTSDMLTVSLNLFMR